MSLPKHSFASVPPQFCVTHGASASSAREPRPRRSWQIPGWWSMPKARWISRFWRDALVALTVLLAAGAARAEGEDASRAAELIGAATDFGQVEQQLAKGKSYALVIGISEF